MLGKIKKNYFLLISTFLIFYFFFNFLEGERGFFSYLKKGDEVLVNDSIYGPTRTFCNNLLKHYGIKIKYFHPINNIKNFEKLISKKTKLIFLE